MSTNGRPLCFRRSFARPSKRTVRAYISIKHKYYISIKYRLKFPRVRFFSVYRNGGKTTVGQRTQWNGYRFQISSRCDKKPFSPISSPRREYSFRRRFLQFVRRFFRACQIPFQRFAGRTALCLSSRAMEISARFLDILRSIDYHVDHLPKDLFANEERLPGLLPVFTWFINNVSTKSNCVTPKELVL